MHKNSNQQQGSHNPSKRATTTFFEKFSLFESRKKPNKEVTPVREHISSNKKGLIKLLSDARFKSQP